MFKSGILEWKYQRDFDTTDNVYRLSSNLLKSFKCIYFTSSSSTDNTSSSEHHHPILINTNNNNISNDFKDLCAKGPSFVPTPEHYNWLQLQNDFDRFANRIRARFIFKDSKDNQNEQVIKKINPPKKPSTWRAPKTSCPEIETFLANIERSIFQDTSRQQIYNNLPKGQREALKNWRKKHLFNSDSDLIMRLQDKGNRFVIVDKDTDTQKA